MTVFSIGSSIVDALRISFGMFWEILWALILGFALSGAVQAVVSKAEMRRLLPDHSPRSLVVAGGLGAASSSCSYAAVALARSLFAFGAASSQRAARPTSPRRQSRSTTRRC